MLAIDAQLRSARTWPGVVSRPAPQPNNQEPITNNRFSRRLRRLRLSALRAPPCSYGNIAQALWTFLTSWTRRSIAAMHAGNERIHGGDHKKVHGRRDQ